nr:hypothetical protein [Planctomycetota bacterium]
MKKTALAKIVILAIVLALIFFFSTNLKKSLPNHPDTASVTADSNINRTVFQKFIVDGGPIVWFVLIPLSLLTLYLVTEYAMIIRRRHLLPEKIACSLTKIIKNHQDQAEFINQIRKKDDLVSISIEYALTSGKNDFFRIKSLA